MEEQIEYAIITREIYSICGIDSPGFCEGVQHVVILTVVLSYF